MASSVSTESQEIDKFVYIMIYSKSCGIDLGSRYVVTGGLGAETKVIRYRNTGIERVLPELQEGRYGHACAKFQNGDGKQVSLSISNC